MPKIPAVSDPIRDQMAEEFADSSGQLCVVHIIDRLVIGGPTNYAISLAADLDPTKFHTHLIVGMPSHGESDRTDDAVQAGAAPLVITDLRREVGLHDLRAFIKILRALLRLKPDVVHTHKSKAGTLGRLAVPLYNWLTPSALLFRPRRCKTVHTFHGHIFEGYFGSLKTRIFLEIERLLGRFCTDRIITISLEQQKDIADKYRVAKGEKVAVIPLAVEINEQAIRPGALRSEFGISPTDIVIGIVGRLCEIKNFPLLLRAFAKARPLVSRDGRALRLVIVGDGHLRNELEALARELSVEEHVAFTGFREDAAVLYCDFDFVALSSLNEGTPITLIEAMLHNLPLLATYVGGVPDLIGLPLYKTSSYDVWEHGITTRSNDVDAFSEAIRLLAEDSNLRARLGKTSRNFAIRCFSKEKLLTETMNLYRKVASPVNGAESRYGSSHWIRKISSDFSPKNQPQRRVDPSS